MVIAVEIENICGFTGRHRFEFREGLNEVVAPNAMGKTSLIKAILAMYVPDIASLEELLNLDSNEGYIKLEVDGNIYVRRFRREKGRVIETESKPVARDPKLKYVVLDMQLGELVRRLVLEGKSDITDYLTKVFRLDEYTKRKESIINQIRELETQIEYLRKEIAELRIFEDEKNKLKEERKEMLKELEKMKEISVEKIRDIQARIAFLERRLGEVNSRVKDLEERVIPVTQEKLKELQAEIERLRSVVNEFYEHYRDPDEYAENLKMRIDRIDKQIDEWKRELSKQLSWQDARIPVVEMALTTKASVCPICGRPVEDPEVFWNARLTVVEDEVRKIRESMIGDYEARISRADNERLRLWKELEEFTKRYNEVREIKSIKLPKYEFEFSNLTKVLESYKKEIEKLRSEREVITREIESLKQQLPEEERRVADERAKIERRLGEIEQRLKDLEEAITVRSEAGKKIVEAERRITELRKELENVENELYSTLAMMKDEFAKIASEVIRELDFSWLRAIRLAGSIEEKRFEVKVVRVLPSGKEVEQSLSTLSTSERMTVALITILTGYRLKIFEEYKGLASILADEALLAFDPYRFEKVIEELKKFSKYVIVTKLAEPSKVPTLAVVHKP
jgi:chromosome segregation ATPase